MLNLDEVAKYVEVNGDKELNILLNEVITKVESLKLKNLAQTKIEDYFIRQIIFIVLANTNIKTLWNKKKYTQDTCDVIFTPKK